MLASLFEHYLCYSLVITATGLVIERGLSHREALAAVRANPKLSIKEQ